MTGSQQTIISVARSSAVLLRKSSLWIFFRSCGGQALDDRIMKGI
jgi:hypothetical protein